MKLTTPLPPPFLLGSLILSALVFNVTPLTAKIETFSGRLSSEAIWQIDVPEAWIRQNIPQTQDTRLPIAEFHTENYKVYVHNFPGMKIAPQAQVERWKRQNKNGYQTVEPQSFSGYQGLLYENDHTLAWALEWAASSKIKGEINSDITFKITSDQTLVTYRDEIVHTIRSFETIEDLCDW